MRSSKEQALVGLLAKDMQRQYGMVMKGEALWRTLGFGSRSSFYRAIDGQLVPVPLFPMRGNRGLYALTRDVAEHLAALRLSASTIGGCDEERSSRENDMT